jgi:hypothetical protein
VLDQCALHALWFWYSRADQQKEKTKWIWD